MPSSCNTVRIYSLCMILVLLMALILGIDPGSRKTGFGIINANGNKTEYVTSGVIRIPEVELSERLKIIFNSITQIINQYCPQEMAIEQVFMAKNAASALKLGQARGAAIVAAVALDMPVSEYEARKVKQSVVGNGAADKLQVQHMVKTLLRLPAVPQEDAADALAVALCHANSSQHLIKLAGSVSFRRGRVV
ncbi:crossover junction endodeoxyribonuclease RuvC [Cellvibrio zantedeschiae]|uniref:Crossover junction endodeoxyribonuclease RuvC n=2 Tax=Cellvibrio zantedeschiae TaxID=1237077 RepID=A0ABQ3ASG4_9GAMM|nr:crossover junction endodeoxyribonuclease RuvC [Cellvibrio zantedeschiae]